MAASGECVPFEGARDKAGYGQVSAGGKKYKAHRLAYERAHGPFPDHLTVDHLCFNPPCVNPDHLRLLTRIENARNQRSAAKTHCDSGHEFTPENTYIRPRRRREGNRDCRTCIRQRVAAYRARRRSA